MGRVSREGKHAQACAAANPEPARSRSRKKGDGKRSRWKVPRRRRGARDRARGGCAAMRERVPNAEFDGIDRYRVRSGLDRTVDARDARTVEVDGGLDGEGAPAGGLGGDGRGALVEALASDGGRHATGRGGGRDARHIRSWFVKWVLRCEAASGNGHHRATFSLQAIQTERSLPSARSATSSTSYRMDFVWLSVTKLCKFGTRFFV